MIVIGGRNSSNSKELYNNLLKVKQTIFIEKPKDIIFFIKACILNETQKIGITAGASTPQNIINNVIDKFGRYDISFNLDQNSFIPSHLALWALFFNLCIRVKLPKQLF